MQRGHVVPSLYLIKGGHYISLRFCHGEVTEDVSREKKGGAHSLNFVTLVLAYPESSIPR
jgi:hypothetical protein